MVSLQSQESTMRFWTGHWWYHYLFAPTLLLQAAVHALQIGTYPIYSFHQRNLSWAGEHEYVSGAIPWKREAQM